MRIRTLPFADKAIDCSGSKTRSVVLQLGRNRGLDMIAELGHFAVIIAFVIAIGQSTVPLVGAQKGWIDWMRLGSPAAIAQFVALGVAFACLTYSFVVSDFSVRLVATNSNSLKPMLYKVAGTWGNHEGSMLLWVLILALFGAMLAVFGGNLPPGLKARALAVQGMIGAAFLAFILWTSNPFWRLFPAPADGNDLNPLLQDPGLAFHPPFLYLGYVGLSMSYSFAIAALIEGRVDAAWARWVRPWTLALAVPVLADGIYVLTGKPGVQSQPFARRASTRAEDAGIVDLAEADCGANNFSSRRAWSPPVRSRPIRHPARRRSRRRSARAPHGVQGCGQPRNRQAAGRSAGLRRTASGA